MDIEKIDHIGIAVSDLESASRKYETLGFELDHVEEVESQGVKVGMFPAGESKIELLEPIEDNSIKAFVEKKGEGIHHVAVGVDDIEKKLDEIRGELALIDEEPREGAGDTKIAFVHPKETHGVLLEFVEE